MGEGGRTELVTGLTNKLIIIRRRKLRIELIRIG